MRLPLVTIILVMLAACGAADDGTQAGDRACASTQPVHARDPADGACLAFTSACTVPAGWTACTSCTDDTSCAATEHCAAAGGGQDRACELNLLCDGDQACSGGSCNFSAPHPCAPGDAACAALGVCQPEAALPPATACASNEECGTDMVCPAAYGACSFDSLGGCPSRCETACVDDTTCAGRHCNVTEICVGALSVATGCRGFCE
jgi:hypothetical protein